MTPSPSPSPPSIASTSASSIAVSFTNERSKTPSHLQHLQSNHIRKAHSSDAESSDDDVRMRGSTSRQSSQWSVTSSTKSNGVNGNTSRELMDDGHVRGEEDGMDDLDEPQSSNDLGGAKGLERGGTVKGHSHASGITRTSSTSYINSKSAALSLKEEPSLGTSINFDNFELPPNHPSLDPVSPQRKKRRRQQKPKVDLTSYSQPDLLKLMAQLLEQIAQANDKLPPVQERMKTVPTMGSEQEVHTVTLDHSVHDPLQHHRKTSLSHPPTPSQADHSPLSHRKLYPSDTLLTASRKSITSPQSHLCFHARNIPSISIEAYLMRILKYCPTTNEVFLSLLVYFDRMARLATASDPENIDEEALSVKSNNTNNERVPFAIDSFNVHRLVIAGVTVASKFFSDVFYTNSRYAKVGGLPLHELNQLELQFLLLNDFNLVIPLEEMQRYADQLLVYWPGGMTMPEDDEEEDEEEEDEEDIGLMKETLHHQRSLGSIFTSESEASTVTPTHPSSGMDHSEEGRTVVE